LALVDEDAFSALTFDAFRIAVASAQTVTERHDAVAAALEGADASTCIKATITTESVIGFDRAIAIRLTRRCARTVALLVTRDIAADPAVATDIRGWAAVAIGVTEAIAARSAVAANARRSTAITIAITEPARTALPAIADLVAVQALAVTADA